jgi:hypothetical protein
MTDCVMGIIRPNGAQKKFTWDLSNQKNTGATVAVE